MASKTSVNLEITNVVGLLHLLNEKALGGRPVIFRGQSEDLPLVPEIGRGPFLRQSKGYDNWLLFEEDLLNRYKMYAAPFISTEPKDDWDWLFSARHHGLPTRLLDWSSSPLKGLYFAVQNHRHDHHDSVLWVMDMVGWVEALPTHSLATLPTMDLVFPRHIHPRIIAQDGCFTAFPMPQDIDDFVPANEQELVSQSFKLTVPANARRSIRIELDGLGISHRTMFPGLDGSVASIRQEFGEGWA